MQNISRLLNVSTHTQDLDLFCRDWTMAEDFLKHWDFDGFELYPVGDYPFGSIPSKLVSGIHLRFFIILAPIWRGDAKRLLEIFGSWENVNLFYGGDDAQCIVDAYTRQLNLAQQFGCSYVVFHPVHCELEYIYSWQFPWQLKETLDLCAEVINAATKASEFTGLLLFENLWWPGSFRLDCPKEYDYLISKVDYPNCGIALDTGHLLNKNPHLTNEDEANEYLLDCVDKLGETAGHIHTIHLTKSLSGDYVKKTRQMDSPFTESQNIWEKLDIARRHAQSIDRHQAFESPRVAALIEKINPAHVVFEFTFKDMVQWEQKIATQKQALAGCLW